ncbi:MAG: hypothetical protein KC425_02335 [Anaerolineales bacterium]|nr:hypothetical protein [Anaerolineales bacterium]
MQVLTHSTLVQSQVKLRRERLLPQPGEVVVSPGQEVSARQVVARTQRAARFHIVPASELWHIEPEAVNEHLVVSEGQEIHAGDVLLQKKRLLGGKTLESPVDGTFYGVNNGRLILQQHEWFELRALVQARVVNAIARRGIVLEIHGSQVQGVWGSGKEGYGGLQVAVETERDPLAASDVGDAIDSQVIVAGVVRDVELFDRLQKGGAAGLIVGTLASELLAPARRAPFPVLVTDGIGGHGMARVIFYLLRKHARSDVALFTREADYWGNRPEIIIPHELTTGMLNESAAHGPLQVGQTVRILRAPYASQVGEVVQLNHRQQAMPTGMSAAGAEVKLADGSIVFVPYANLDTIV